MTGLYKIRLVYEPCPSGVAWADAAMPDITEEETVQVEAETLEQAVRRAMFHNKIDANGRLVRYFDELGKEIFTF